MRLFIPLLALSLAAAPAIAQDSVHDASAAGGASSEVATHLTASGVRTAIGVAVIPVGIAASAAAGPASAATLGGAASLGLADGASRAATTSKETASGPLKVDDRVVVSPDLAPIGGQPQPGVRREHDVSAGVGAQRCDRAIDRGVAAPRPRASPHRLA